jgi:hypothetical protein
MEGKKISPLPPCMGEQKILIQNMGKKVPTR